MHRIYEQIWEYVLWFGEMDLKTLVFFFFFYLLFLIKFHLVYYFKNPKNWNYVKIELV
jgi:hypothetical protein